MEYEQLEVGDKAIVRAIRNQDVGDVVDLLSPDVMLFTHFPYPDGNEQGTATSVGAATTEPMKLLRQRLKPDRRKRQLLDALDAQLLRMRAAYEAHQRPLTGSRAAKEGFHDRGAAAKGNTARAAQAAPGGEAPVAKSSPGRGRPTAARELPSRSRSQSDGAASGTQRLPKGVQLYLQNPRGTDLEAQSDERASGPVPNAASYADMAANYGERVDLAEGPLLVAERFYLLLSWIGQSRFIADVQSRFRPRKSILQDNEVLPPPPEPTNEAERFALLGRQYTDRNQRLSILTVVWGREYLLFRDYYYFDDGHIVTIHRHMLGLQEMLEMLVRVQDGLNAAQLTDRIYDEVKDLYGVSRRRIAATNHAWPMLDFSFQHIPDPLHLLRVTPVTGKKHICRPEKPAVDPRLAQGVFLNQQNDPTRSNGGGRTLIKAKNKRGEEEAYEFETSAAPHRYSYLMDAEENQENSVENLAQMLKQKYDATSMRVSSCKLATQMEQFIPAMRVLVANAFLTLHSLDLSGNQLSYLPDFSVLPLQKLQLHGNLISSWDEVERRVCPLPLLFSLTLHGNPLAENNAEYWPMALARLLRHPNRLVKLRQLDFVTLTACDYNVAGAHEMFTTGSRHVLQAAQSTKVRR